MHWLSFLIGALVGWLIEWLIDYLICRRRRMAAEALLKAKLKFSSEESASLKAQLAGCKDVQVRLDVANAEIEALRAQVAGMRDLQARLDGANKQIDSLKAQLAEMNELRADLTACRAEATQQRLEIGRLNAELAARAGAGTGGAAAAEDASKRAPETDVALTPLTPEPGGLDDLTRIEGVGPKIQALLNENGLHTFAQLAETGVERLEAILRSGGNRFSLANPSTWPEQALLARDGKWDALDALQDSLKGGRVV